MRWHADALSRSADVWSQSCGATIEAMAPAGSAASMPVGETVRRITRSVSGSRVSIRSEEHTSELQSLMRISYAVFCLKKKKQKAIYANTKNTINNNKT